MRSQRVNRTKEIDGDDPKKQTYSSLKGAVFFSAVNAFIGFGWVAMEEKILRARVFVFIVLLLLDFGSILFTYLNFKKVVVWFRHITLSIGVFTFYAVMISLDALMKVMNSYITSAGLLLFSLIVVFIFGYRAYKKIWDETLPQNSSSGKIDLKNGIYSLITAPAVYSFKSKVLRGTSAFIVGGGSYLLGIGVFLGIRLSRGEVGQKSDVYKSILFGLCSILFTLVTSWLFYQYQWVRNWQKKNNKIMVTKYV